MKAVVAFLVGVLFAIGLGISGMTQPHIVRGFLDITNWDWRLVGVMAGAVVVHGIAFRIIMKRPSPILSPSFSLPTRKDVDVRLIAGSILFGLGWGWAGICPGPGIVSLISGKTAFMYFVASMLVGMKIFQFVDAKILSKK